MKTIGLLGGMGWPSTITYYRLINEGVGARLGGHHSARIVLWSVDFAEVEAAQHADDWDRLGALMVEGCTRLQMAGADMVVLCTNTMHRLAPVMQRELSIPLIHIADATAAAATERGMSRVGLLGTRFTMEGDFYRGRLQQLGLDVEVPDAADRQIVHDIIYDELVHGVVTDDSRRAYAGIMRTLAGRGAEGIILGCTEIGLLVSRNDLPGVPLLDTTEVHAAAAVRAALQNP